MASAKVQANSMPKLLVVALLPWLAGCLAPGPNPGSYRAAYLPPARCPAGIVFVANGAGDYRTVTRNLTQVVAETGAPLQIETVLWSRGYRRYLSDQVDHCNHLAQARRLVWQIDAYRQAYPGRRIYLIGHSAGCAVILAAAELQPPDSIERIILLAPSVCAAYDLRPALRAARGGIDVFHSSEDRWVLGLGMWVAGTTEGQCRAAAGRGGFQLITDSAADVALYGRLRQHPWHPILERSGHDGGHFGSTEPELLRAYVLPLLS
jgi:pimeloyl-ACP methyl ester carboxylesterase